MRSLAERNAAVIERVRAGNEKARMDAADRVLTQALQAWLDSSDDRDLLHATTLAGLALHGCPRILGASDA